MANSYTSETGSFVLNMLFEYLGLDEQQQQVVTAAMPYAQALVTRYNANIGLINTFVADINKVAPAAQILINALAAKSQ